MYGFVSVPNALPPRLIGAIFLERGLVTEDQLQAALALQKETKDHLGEILVQHFGVSRIELASVLAEQWAELERANAGARGADKGGAPTPRPVELVQAVDDAAALEPGAGEPTEGEPAEGEGIRGQRRPLGEILVEQALVTDDELDQALQAQRESGEKLGEILVAQGSITRLQLASALADQWTALRKIRPPSSAGPVKPQPTGAPSETSSADVDRLHEAVDALEQRLRAAESLASREPWREEISVATDGLQETVAALEGRLGAIESREEPEAFVDVRTTLDELAARVEALAASGPAVDKDVLRRVESAAEAAEAARSGLGGAFESLSLRLSDVESRVHDRSEIAELKTELESLAQRLPEPGAEEHGNAELEALRDEVRRLLDELNRRVEAPLRDPQIAERVEELGQQVEELAGAVRGAEGGKKSSSEVKALKEALAALGGSVQELANESKLGLEDLRSTVAELQARPAESDLADRLSHYGAGPDHIDELKERLGEAEGRLAELGQLTELRAAVDELAARPPGDPVLAERVDALARELEESSGLQGELTELRSHVDELAGAVGEVAELRLTVESLAEQAWAPATDLSELRSEISALGSRLDAFARHSTEVATYEQVADLGVRLGELEEATTHEEIAELRRELSALGQRLDTVAETSSEAVPRDQLEVLEARLAALSEAMASKAEVTGLAGRVDAIEGIGQGLDELRRELDTVSVRVGSPIEDLSHLRVEVAALARRLDVLADRASDAVASERFDDLSSRVGAELDRLRRALDELSGRPVADADLVDTLTRRVEELGATEDVDELRRRLDALSEQVGAPSEDVSELRAALASLQKRLDDVTERSTEAASSGQVEQLSSRLAALEQSMAEPRATDELDQLGRRLDALSERVAAPSEDVSELRAELASLTERLDGFADRSTEVVANAHVEELTSRLAALEQSMPEPRATDELDQLRRELGTVSARLDDVTERSTEAASSGQVEHLSSRLAALEQSMPEPRATDELDQLGRRLDALSERVAAPSEEVAHLRTELAALAVRLDATSDRVGGDPELTERVEQLAREVTEIARAAEAARSEATSSAESVADDLRAELQRLAKHVAAVQELAAAEPSAEHDSRIESLEQQVAERESLDAVLGARIDDVAERLAAAAELSTRLDDVIARVEAHDAERADSVAKSDLAKLRRDLKEKLGDLQQRVDGLAASTGESEESIVQGLEEAVGGLRDELQVQLQAGLEAQLQAQRKKVGDRVDAAVHETASLREELVELREAAGERIEAQARAEADLVRRMEELAGALEGGASAHADLTAALAEVRAELSMLSARVDAPDTATTQAVEALRVELAEVVEFVRSSQTKPGRPPEIGPESGPENGDAPRLADEGVDLRFGTESGPVEKKKKGKKSKKAVSVQAARVEAVRTTEDTPVAEAETPGAFLAFVPLDQGYSLQEILGSPPAVGEPMAVANGDAEFVVTRIGRSPLPLDRRPCVYLELAVLGNPSDRVT